MITNDLGMGRNNKGTINEFQRPMSIGNGGGIHCDTKKGEKTVLKNEQRPLTWTWSRLETLSGGAKGDAAIAAEDVKNANKASERMVDDDMLCDD